MTTCAAPAPSLRRASPRRAAFPAACLLALCLASALLGRLSFLSHPFDSDSAMFIYMGKLVTNGGRIGIELIDNKFPTVGLVTSIPWRVFGDRWPAYVLLQTALSLAGAALLARAARRNISPHAALPTALFALVYLNFNPVVFGGFQLETLQAFFVILAASAAMASLTENDPHGNSFIASSGAKISDTAEKMQPRSREAAKEDAKQINMHFYIMNLSSSRLSWRPSRLGGSINFGNGYAGLGDSFLVGLAAGTAALLKPSGLAVLAAFAIATIWQRRRQPLRLTAHAAAALVGLAIAAAVTLLYLWAADLFSVIPVLTRQISRYASQSPWEPWDLSKPLVILIIAGFPLLVRGVIFRRQRINDAKPASVILAFVLLWTILEAAGIAAQRRMYAYHFLLLAAPLSLLFGLIPRPNRPWPLLAALAGPILLSAAGAAWTLKDAHWPLDRLPASDYLAAHAAPGDAVWQDGLPRLLIETDLQPGSRYPMTFLWVNDDDAPLQYCRAMLEDFQQRRPQYILLPTPTYIQAVSMHIKELGLRPRRKSNYIQAWQELRDYVQQHYAPEAQVGRETVYRRLPMANNAKIPR